MVWVPFSGGGPTGAWSVFADGFAGGRITYPDQADFRPSGVAVGPDGSIYVSDSLRGRIWKIFFGKSSPLTLANMPALLQFSLRPPRLRSVFPLPAALFLVTACGTDEPGGIDAPTEPPEDTTEVAPPPDPVCDSTITVPTGYCARIFHPGVGPARQVAVSASGDVFVAIRNAGGSRGGVVALRDGDGDGEAETRERWGNEGGSGIALGDGALYLATATSILRYPLGEGDLVPSGSPDVIVSGLPADRNHPTKSVALHPDGYLFVGIGSPSNACQSVPRTPGVPGKDPCEERDLRAGVWRFASDRLGQSQSDGERFAAGVRNAAALAVHPSTGDLYAVVHGRDQLRELWPRLYTSEQGSENPSEEFVRLEQGADFGWPYCYHDPATDKKILAPEYGGDGSEIGRCSGMAMPELGLPAHWAPNAMAFSPSGAYVAFHGSWNRTPVQAGYNVVWVPFDDDRPTGAWSVFADGFAGGQVTSSSQAVFRPTGVAVGPDGSVYVSDSRRGRVWRIAEEG